MIEWFRRFGDIPGITYAKDPAIDPTKLRVTPQFLRSAPTTQVGSATSTSHGSSARAWEDRHRRLTAGPSATSPVSTVPRCS